MRRLLFLSISCLLALSAVSAQVRPIYDRGASGLTLLIGRLQTTASAIHTGAHPDDEDSGLVATLARGDHARVAYLSLNRGEGGQNIIGTELFEALGVIRTEELLQARRLDGGAQFFTRAMDFGFSKSLEEAATKWGRREILGDMVRVIRQYRPLVIASRFSGTPADGHGQHQLAGSLTPIAFKAAADAAQFPEQIAGGLRPWQARKLYVGQGFRPDPANPPTSRIETGRMNAVIGRSYGEIAWEGRSQHKSQEMGAIELLGPQFSELRLLSGPARPVGTIESSLFDGIDTSVRGIAALSGLPTGSLSAELAEMQAAADEAARGYDARRPHTILPALARGLTATRAARTRAGTVSAPPDARAEADFLLAFKEADYVQAIALAAGVTVDPLANAETVVPGDAVTVTVRTFVADGTAAVKIGTPRVDAPAGWTMAASANAPDDDSNPFARFFRETPTATASFRAQAPADARPTEPYWLAEPRKGDVFEWAAGDPVGAPFAPPLLHARVPVEVNGVTFDIVRPVEYRYADRVRGEIRRGVEVVPAVAVGLDSRLLVVPTGSAGQIRTLSVRVSSQSRASISGVVRLQLPAGWRATPAEASFALANGERTSASFTVQSPTPVAAGRFEIRAVATVGAQTFGQDMQVVAYPHIQTRRLYSPAVARVEAFDLSVAQVNVGYVMGSGDQVPDAIRRLGVPVTLIDTETLTTGDLSKFDTIVVGVRASEARPDFVASAGRLRQYMERGGTLIVQYQQGDYAERGLAPFPGQIGARVTDETAAVTMLQPQHRRFQAPNRISAADFAGWVQERNLYSFSTFDNRYTALLESGDPGENANRGGELYAEVGKGRYVYTSYAWFRQLPAGVPGAYRLFANLISLGARP